MVKEVNNNNTKNNKSEIYIGSICCGMGVFDTGLEVVGIHTRWAIDVMPEACQSFKANHPNTNVVCEDILKIGDFSKLGKVTGLCFGPPCQGFSKANCKRSMADPRNYVYKATLKAVSQCNEEFFIFENVVGLLDMKFDSGSSVFQKIKADYENCGKGYDVAWQIIDCAAVGVPQANRLRLIMVGFRKDLGHKYNFSKLTHGIGMGKKPFVTLKDTIWHLKDVNQEGDYYDSPYDWKFLSRKRQKGWNEPSYTIEASARYAKIHPGFGKMKWIGENKWFIPKECRRFSTLESKLIQTFTADYIVCGSLEKKYEQIGNSVPPKLASFIGNPIVNYYNLKENNNSVTQTIDQESEKAWLINQLKVTPKNTFYKGLLDWILCGKQLTVKQRKYILISNNEITQTTA